LNLEAVASRLQEIEKESIEIDEKIRGFCEEL